MTDLSNNPPADDIEEMALQKLEHDTGLASAEITDRFELLVAAEARCPVIVDDVTAGQVSDYIKMVQTCQKRAKDKHGDLKSPWLNRGRVIDMFFKRITEPLEAIRVRQLAKVTTYLRAKEKAERDRRLAELAEQERIERERRAEAAQLAEAARLAEVQAKSSSATAAMLLDGAVEAEGEAELAAQELPAMERRAEAAPAELARTRGAASVSTLQRRWVGEVIDLDVLDLNALKPYFKADAIQAALNAYVRIHEGAKPLAGALIEQRSFGRV